MAGKSLVCTAKDVRVASAGNARDLQGAPSPRASADSRRHRLFFASTPRWKIAVRVNGKVRCGITVARDADGATARPMALADEGAKPHLEGKTVRKVVYVPVRIVNLIVG